MKKSLMYGGAVVVLLALGAAYGKRLPLVSTIASKLPGSTVL